MEILWHLNPPGITIAAAHRFDAGMHIQMALQANIFSGDFFDSEITTILQIALNLE